MGAKEIIESEIFDQQSVDQRFASQRILIHHQAAAGIAKGVGAVSQRAFDRAFGAVRSGDRSVDEQVFEKIHDVRSLANNLITGPLQKIGSGTGPPVSASRLAGHRFVISTVRNSTASRRPLSCSRISSCCENGQTGIW